jgi:ankyrin repeat protein
MRHIGNDLGHYVYLPNCDKWNPLQVAVHTWALDLLKYLITKKGGIDHKRDRALLDTAAIVGDLACVKYLVEKCGLDVGQIDDDGGSPLHYAASKGNLSCMLYFIGKIKEENVPELLNHQGGRYNNSPLHCLVVSRELEDDPEKFRQVVEALQGNKSLLNNRGKLPLDLGLNNLLIDIDLLYDHDTVTNRDPSVESQCSKALE